MGERKFSKGIGVCTRSSPNRLHKPPNIFLTLVKLSDRLGADSRGNPPDAGHADMSWTTEKPKSIGVYWHRATPAAQSHPVKIYNVGTHFFVWPIEEDGRANITVRLEDCSGEWAGPMMPPG